MPARPQKISLREAKAAIEAAEKGGDLREITQATAEAVKAVIDSLIAKDAQGRANEARLKGLPSPD